MIIWRGRGILVLILGVGAAMAAGFTATTLGGDSLSNEWKLVIALWAGAAAVLLFGMTSGKTEEKTLLDPATHQPVRLRTVHSLYGVSAITWGWLAVAAAIYGTFLALTSPSGGSHGGGSGRASTDTGFANANRLINAFDGGSEVYGNTGAATKLAEQFAAAVKEGRELGIEKGKERIFSTSGGHFLTYCQLDAEHCAFLVHVPDIRHFKEDAKEWLAKTCWVVARQLSAGANPVPKHLAVGIRGAIFYDRVLVGESSADGNNLEGGLKQTLTGNDSKDALGSFFAAAARQPNQPSPVRKTGTAPEIFIFANAYITSQKTTPESGNSPEAVQLSRNYSKTVAQIYASAVEQEVNGKRIPGKLPIFSYCHLGKDSCVMVCFIPHLKSLTGEPRDFLVRTSWEMGCMAARCLKPRPARLAVGLRDEDGYQVVQIGKGTQTDADVPAAGIEKTLAGADAEQALLPFFEPYQGPPILLINTLTVGHADGSPVVPEPKPAVTKHAAPVPPASPESFTLPTPQREWKDATGRVMKAALERFTTPAGDIAEFKREDGNLFQVPVSKFSPEASRTATMTRPCWPSLPPKRSPLRNKPGRVLSPDAIFHST